MIAWLKSCWRRLMFGVVLAIALGLWWFSRKRSGWAARKILELQGETESQIEQITDKAASRQRQLDNAWRKRRKAIKEAEQRKIARIREEARRLDAAALKRRVLEDLDDPL